MTPSGRPARAGRTTDADAAARPCRSARRECWAEAGVGEGVCEHVGVVRVWGVWEERVVKGKAGARKAVLLMVGEKLAKLGR